GIGATAFGIKEQKTVYSEQHYTEAEVVGHQNARTHNLTINAINTVTGTVNPLVSIMLENGIKKVVPLHEDLPRASFSKFPELDLGGKVSVTYFGSDPKTAYLTGHPLAQKPLRSSSALLIGIVFLLIGLGLLVLGIFTSFQ
ncbi:MAG TPA: hypothetical protein DCG49_11020, partial [Ruminococcus sp.]|nr:hypothetical protein [Ruminococcus sp.]